MKLIKIDRLNRINLLYKYSIDIYYNYIKLCCKDSILLKEQIEMANRIKNTDIFKFFITTRIDKKSLNRRENIISRILSIKEMYIVLLIVNLLIRSSLIKWLYWLFFGYCTL